MAAIPPPPTDGVVSPRPRPWRLLAVALLAAAVLISAVTGYWFVSRTGPFADIEPSTWALGMTGVVDLHAQNLTGRGVTVCVVDTGVDLSHPELSHVRLVGWRDFVNDRRDPYDDEGHGTAMAGIILARGRLTGVAPGAQLIAVKAISATGSGTDARVASAVAFCTDPNQDGNDEDSAHVVSLSLGGTPRPFLGSATDEAVNRAMDRGVVVVAAAGNDGRDDNGDVESPASVPRVLAVGAVDRQGVIAPFSSRGQNDGPFPLPSRQDPDKKPEVVAPGVEIATLLDGGGYAYVTGTSPAAAFVAGIVALLLEAHPLYRLNAGLLGALKVAFMDGASPVDGQTVPHDDRYGYGIVQAAATSARM